MNDEPGTRIRVRSMNHSACTVDVDAEREPATDGTNREKGRKNVKAREPAGKPDRNVHVDEERRKIQALESVR